MKRAALVGFAVSVLAAVMLVPAALASYPPPGGGGLVCAHSGHIPDWSQNNNIPSGCNNTSLVGFWAYKAGSPTGFGCWDTGYEAIVKNVDSAGNWTTAYDAFPFCFDGVWHYSSLSYTPTQVAYIKSVKSAGIDWKIYHYS